MTLVKLQRGHVPLDQADLLVGIECNREYHRLTTMQAPQGPSVPPSGPTTARSKTVHRFSATEEKIALSEDSHFETSSTEG